MEWPQSTMGDPGLAPYTCRRNELSIQDGCVLWGSRVVIPTKLRSDLLTELHSGHTGSTRMKELARSYLWWPDLDKQLEEVCSSCATCLEVRSAPPKAELHPWEWPTALWHRIHVDYAGPIEGKYLIIVDAHSKWAEVFQTSGTTSEITINGLRNTFSRFGIPVSLVTDNGPAFTSEEFANFSKFCGFKHHKTAVYKPATNGLAERLYKPLSEA